MDHIPAGTRTIEVRSIGLLPMTVSMDFATNAARDTTLSVSRQAQPLKPVAVKESAILPSWMERSGFETRRLQGMGAFVTEQDIARHGFSDLISVLEGVRGIHVEYGGQGGRGWGTPFLLGVTSIQGKNGVRCLPNYFLDGVRFPDDFAQLSGLAYPEAIKGIEVYSNPGTIPAQYDLTSSTGCGSIVIWTR